MKERLILCVRHKVLDKNYHFNLYVIQSSPLLKTGTSGQFVTCTWERIMHGRSLVKWIPWLFSSQLKMSFNVTGYIDVRFERAKIQSRRLVCLFFCILSNQNNTVILRNRLLKMWILIRKKWKGLKQVYHFNYIKRQYFRKHFDIYKMVCKYRHYIITIEIYLKFQWVFI